MSFNPRKLRNINYSNYKNGNLDMKLSIVFCLILFSSTCLAQGDATKTAAKTDVESKLRPELKTLEPLLGTWVMEIKQEDGPTFWATRRYTVGMDGNYVDEKIFDKTEDGKEHHRYHAVWRWDKNNTKIVSHGFTHDGNYDEFKPTVDSNANGLPVITIISARPGSPVATQQTIKLIDETTYQWSASASAAKDNPILERTFKKQQNR